MHVNTTPLLYPGVEFFQRFPALHGFLLQQLHEATRSIGIPPSGCSGGSSSGTDAVGQHAGAVHPGLYPVLILLSRLQPGVGGGAVAKGVSSPLSPSAFLPLVQLCSANSPLMSVRQLAAKAYVPMIVGGCGVGASLPMVTALEELITKLSSRSPPLLSQNAKQVDYIWNCNSSMFLCLSSVNCVCCNQPEGCNSKRSYL